jgi:hypothetical protein
MKLKERKAEAGNSLKSLESCGNVQLASLELTIPLTMDHPRIRYHPWTERPSHKLHKGG